MDKNIKILIIGFGSIGRRHYQNLLKLGFKNIYVYDIDKNKLAGEKLKTTEKINAGTLKQFRAVLICNPNDAHVQTAIKCAQAGCHIFIEKPLAPSLKNIKALVKICHSKKLTNMVACNLRFHPCLKFIKNYLDKNSLGKIYSIRHDFGYFLPYWRPEQDYRKNYAAKKASGGGIILDDIHEFDLLFWFNGFSPVVETKFIFDKTSALAIETEDNCVAAFKFVNKTLGSVSCDYLQQAYSRNCKIVGAKGNLTWDFNENIVWLHAKKRKNNLFQIKNYQANQMYLDELSYFFWCVFKRQPAANDIKTAALVLKYCINKI
ncbi:hypothetical protein COU00_02610 [Candidatus Falkowbacteria bacterium CG10_big_fil_rev_8_21_14_0_10_43_11]|uniref:Gfo/Idh/MocA-like oxidoreductase N-terminal domain-containing protein n=1 Tax=Candidatus Falkowbacteria bacterium CG10_big_fil_rev_8_21_14_0_10_43_11 TaxID=1974568 RepID=A0A2M6WLX6_9BACT|nr:MAG: hypothetical protein COU00_02610 [Candidatus Falkowbacteria bacterium CG10_big_fil_rev_8_21_14_0_10_43_11]